MKLLKDLACTVPIGLTTAFVFWLCLNFPFPSSNPVAVVQTLTVEPYDSSQHHIGADYLQGSGEDRHSLQFAPIMNLQ